MAHMKQGRVRAAQERTAPAKEPKPNFSSFTKAELIKTIKKLDARQTRLLNVARNANDLLEATQAVAAALQGRVQELEAELAGKQPELISVVREGAFSDELLQKAGVEPNQSPRWRAYSDADAAPAAEPGPALPWETK